MTSPNEPQILPRFLVLGTYRAGTTWLHEVLRHHPKLFLPAEKELMFFSANFDKGPDWYASFFAKCPDGQIPGEICPTYFSEKDAPDRIRSVLGMPKLAVILRRPSEQVASMHQLWRMRGTNTDSLEHAIQTKPWLLHNVMYGAHLANYDRVFGPRHVVVLFYDDLVENPRGFLDQVYAWLGIEPVYNDAVDIRANASRQLRSQRIEQFVAWGGDFFRRHGALGIKSLLNRSGIVALIKRANAGSTRDVSVPPTVRDLIERVTVEDRRDLGARIGRDLSKWV